MFVKNIQYLPNLNYLKLNVTLVATIPNPFDCHTLESGRIKIENSIPRDREQKVLTV